MGVIMADQKIENLLNLAAGSTNSEKEKSENLGVGFDPAERYLGDYCEVYRGIFCHLPIDTPAFGLYLYWDSMPL